MKEFGFNLHRQHFKSPKEEKKMGKREEKGSEKKKS